MQLLPTSWMIQTSPYKSFTFSCYFFFLGGALGFFSAFGAAFALPPVLAVDLAAVFLGCWKENEAYS